MELEFEKYCVIDGSPKTVLPSPRHRSKVEKRKARSKPNCRNDLLNTKNKDFTELNFHCYRSASCRDVPSRKTLLDSNEGLKRGSVYQSSKEVRKMKRTNDFEGRRKIELRRGSATALSVGFLDSLCSSDEDSSLVEQNISIETCSEDFISLSCQPVSDERANSVERESVEGVGPICREAAFTLHKSLSAKLALPHLPSQSDSDSFKLTSSKTRFSPLRRMFDPFLKSKSQRSPLGSAVGPGEVTPSGRTGISRSKTLRKSLLHDFSNTSYLKECNSRFDKKEHRESLVPCSPTHLRGFLKLENKHGLPVFEFSVKFPGDVFVAKTWKVGNGVNWVYTFHALHNKRKSNSSGWGFRDSNKDSSLLGQMKVSCYLCTELKDAGDFDNSMVNEFVLYDIAGERKKVAPCELEEVYNQIKLQPKQGLDSGSNDWALNQRVQAELHAEQEIAAIVIQVPFDKKESLKGKRGDFDLSAVDPRKEDGSGCLSPAKVNVVTPCGNHSFPAESGGPSPLLDRWRLGGGCDCGGWDTGCPLVVFGNPNVQFADQEPSLVENQRPLELFVQGTKEKTPALTMMVSKEGHYTIDFHAQLSALQVFAICIAILHGMEPAIADGEEEREKQLLHCDSLRVLIGEEVKYLIEAVTEEEKRKTNDNLEEMPPSFLLNPPFSPISRV
ncbi:hypothetical protein LguiB_034671 [Lonicera macranthoides]